MSDPLNLQGMDPKDAKQYVLAVITTLKQTQRKRESLEQELDTWQRRKSLAQQKGEEELALRAGMRVDEIASQVEALREEEAQFQSEIRALKQQLHHLEHTAHLTVDPDALLAQMQMMTGEVDETAEKFKEEESNLALERLKQKLRDEDADKTDDR
jgi:phage shock protein A